MRRPILVLGAGLLLLGPAAVAQDRKGGMSSKANASWVKLCETPTAASTDLFGKPRAVGIKTCLVLAEQLDAATGAVRVTTGVQEAKGLQTLMIRVAPDASREHRVGLTILPDEIWERVQRKDNSPLTEAQLSKVQRLKLTYSSCNVEGCIAEIDATPKLVADLKKGGGLMVSILKGKHAFTYMVSLGGFREAYDGPSVDAARFLKAREDLLRALRERNRQRAPPPAPAPPRGKGDQPQPPPPGKGDQRI
jgi:invasion protein IalB